MPKVIVFGNTLVNTLGLIRSIGESGLHVDLLVEPCSRNHCFVHHSKYVRRTFFLTTMDEALEVLRREYWTEVEKPVILCGSDPSICLLDAHYDELKDHFAIFNANGEQGRINYFMDKSNQFPIAEQCGLNLIKTWRVTDITHLPVGISYPCLIKGNNSTRSTKGDMFICQNEQELHANLHEGVEYLIQEYIEKDFELDIVGFSMHHGNDIYVPAVVRKIRDTIRRQSVYIRLDDIAVYPNLGVEWIKSFINEIGYEGIFSIEVICRKEKYYFLEMNLRNDACGYLYTAAGINYPLLWVLCNGGKTLRDLKLSFTGKTPLYLMHENDLYNLWEGKVSLFCWLRDFWRSGAFFVLNWRDPLPFAASTWIHFRQACKKVLRLITKA